MDKYLTFASGVQALGRRTDGMTWGLGGALGVAADPYPHQISTVRSILCDIRIRHLIADEVGLGKTLQALMIVNALRYQNPDHRTAILAPNRLIEQWRTEAWTRAHLLADFLGSDHEYAIRHDARSATLIRPRDIPDLDFRIEDRFDMLIVDEPQSIPLELIERIARESTGVRQVLVLSATPRLSDPRWRDIIFQMLEPERFGLASIKPTNFGQYLESIEESAAQALEEIPIHVRQPEGVQSFLKYSTARRVIRHTRKDWGKYLPTRKNIVIKFEPTEAERLRLEIATKVLKAYPGKTDLTSWPWLPVQGLLRSRRSARRALDTISENYDKPLPLENIKVVRELTIKNPGDTRFEALLDVLAKNWSEHISEKFIIVAGDARTIDMLSSKLPRYFPNLANPGSIATLKRPGSSSQRTAEDIREMAENLKPFVDGDASVLILGDWVQAGLNLQHSSRNIIFYSLPWDPQAIDQLIGRIDRFRKNGLHKGNAGKHFGNIRIWRLIMNQSPEVGVSEALDAIDVFEHPLPTISETEFLTINSELEKLARNPKLISSLEILRNASALRKAHGTASSLSPYNPLTPLAASTFSDQWNEIEPTEPQMGITSGFSDPVSKSEIHFENWLGLIEKSEQFSIGYRRDISDEKSRFRTIWYQHRQQGFPFPLATMGTDDWRSDHVPFITRRRNLSAPPKSIVKTDGGEENGRPLRFLDHGDPIHDSLIDGFIKKCDGMFGGTKVHEIRVRLSKEHPLFEFSQEPLLLSASFVNFGDVMQCEKISTRMKTLLEQSKTDRQRQDMLADIRLYQDQIRADQRWLQHQLLSKLELQVSSFKVDGWTPVDTKLAPLFFKPLGEDGRFMPMPKTMHNNQIAQPLKKRGAAIEVHERLFRDTFREYFSRNIQTLRKDLQDRLDRIIVEGNDLVKLRKMRWENRGLETPDESQVNMWRGQVDAAENRKIMAEEIAQTRETSLANIVESLSKTPKLKTWHLFVRLVPYE